MSFMQALKGKKTPSKKEVEAIVAYNGEHHNQVMGKFQHAMQHLSLHPQTFLDISSIVLVKRMTDEDAQQVDAMIEALRCQTCQQIGNSCTCRVRK